MKLCAKVQEPVDALFFEVSDVLFLFGFFRHLVFHAVYFKLMMAMTTLNLVTL
jgi:hypothetical protein